MADTIVQLFGYTFFKHAILAILFISIISAVIGAWVVSRRMVFIAGGVTHASFGGIGLFYYLGLYPETGALLFGILSALGIEKISANKKIRNDSAIAVIWALGMTIGLIFVFLTPGYTPELMSFLFGDMLTISRRTLIQLAITAFVIVFAFIIWNRSLLYLAFDAGFLISQSRKYKALNTIMLILVAAAVVIMIRSIGIVLALSVLTIPVSVSNFFHHSFNKIVVSAAILTFIVSLAGLIPSYYFNIPAGISIVFCLSLVFIAAALLKRKTGSQREPVKSNQTKQP